MTQTLTESALQSWIGRSESRSETLPAGPLDCLQATLDREGPRFEVGDPVPPLWHWVFFNPLSRSEELGEDGHPQRGGFLPPVRLPRRMWVGGSLALHIPLRVGDEVQRESRIDNISVKAGRSGALTLVTVTHKFTSSGQTALCETQNLMYRGDSHAAAADCAEDAPRNETFKRELVPSTTLLFRYAALTFNAHRIHYDRPYAHTFEGYPGLVVQGPLIATLLVDLLRRHRPAASLRSFKFKALRPLFDAQPIALCGRESSTDEYVLWARDGEGKLAMQAHAQLV